MTAARPLHVLLSLVLLAASPSGLSCNKCSDEESPSAPNLSIGFITVGPVADSGFNHAIEEGRKFLESKLGDRITTTLVEKIPESADVERVMERLIRDGTDLIFPTSFGYLDPALRTAEKHPQTIFMHTGGYKTARNFGTFTAYLDEPFYLAGMVAGYVTKTKKLGFVAAHPVPPVVREINALALGAQRVDPDIRVIVVWTGGWSDPGKEAEAATRLIDAGCDVLASHQDSPVAIIRTAESRGAYSIGVHSDCSKFAPKGWLTGAEWNWGPFLVQIVQSILDGTWKPAMLRGGLAEDYVKLSPFGEAVPERARQEARVLLGKLKARELDIFAGPLVDSEGTVRLPGGEILGFEAREGMDWFVKGVEGGRH